MGNVHAVSSWAGTISEKQPGVPMERGKVERGVQGCSEHHFGHPDVAVPLVQAHVSILPSQPPESSRASSLHASHALQDSHDHDEQQQLLSQTDKHEHQHQLLHQVSVGRITRCVRLWTAWLCTAGRCPRQAPQARAHPSTSGMCRLMFQWGHSCRLSPHRYCRHS